MPADSPIKIESYLLGTWKISETLNDGAIFKIGEFTNTEITEFKELEYDVFEMKSLKHTQNLMYYVLMKRPKRYLVNTLKF
jgi:hypothetical protein